MMEDDQSIPHETRIYYSRSKAIGNMLMLICLMAVGMYLVFFTGRFGSYRHTDTTTYFMGAFCVLFPLLVLFGDYKRFTNKTPQIILDNKGIQINMVSNKFLSFSTANPQFYKWEEIGNEYVDEIREGRSNVLKLTFITPTGDVAYAITALDINQDDLNYLLEVYRKRSGKKFYYHE